MASLKADNDRLQKMAGRSPATSPGSGNESSTDNRLSLGDPSSLGEYRLGGFISNGAIVQWKI
jgi:hypothetical protein